MNGTVELEVKQNRLQKPSARGSVARLIAALVVALVGVLLFVVAANYPEWISGGYQRFTRAAMRAVGSVWALLPFSAVEILIYAAIAVVLAALVITIVHAVRWGGFLARALKFISHIALAAAILFTSFTATWGMNYRSAGLASALGLEVRERSSDTLAAALGEIADELGEVISDLPRAADGSVDWGDFRSQAEIARDAWEALAKVEPYFSDAKPLECKPVLASRGLSYMGITGVFVALTGEANVNADFPDPGRIFTMAHETAHSMGVARENEANFAAMLACRASKDPLARYSGLITEFIYCYNALVSVDREAAFECWYKLPVETTSDYAERNAYWKQFEGKVQDAATSVNDAYLKAMAQPSGVKSYGEVVDLILADFVARTGYVEAPR